MKLKKNWQVFILLDILLSELQNNITLTFLIIRYNFVIIKYISLIYR
jgi:hypothetical protein